MRTCKIAGRQTPGWQPCNNITGSKAERNLQWQGPPPSQRASPPPRAPWPAWARQRAASACPRGRGWRAPAGSARCGAPPAPDSARRRGHRLGKRLPGRCTFQHRPRNYAARHACVLASLPCPTQQCVLSAATHHRLLRRLPGVHLEHAHPHQQLVHQLHLHPPRRRLRCCMRVLPWRAAVRRQTNVAWHAFQVAAEPPQTRRRAAPSGRYT